MKNNYNIRFNPPELSDDEIRKHQDFNALLKQFEDNKVREQPKQAKRISLKSWSIASAAIAATLVGAIFFFNQGDNNAWDYEAESQTYFAELGENHTPYSNTQIDFSNKKINADKNQSLQFNSDTKINFPKAAFVNNTGNPVKGDIDINYRELNSIGDLFLSGTPAFQGENPKYIEIFAKQNGKELKINSEKNIELVYTSEVEVPANSNIAPSLDLFQLDNKNLTWKKWGSSTSEFINDNSNNSNTTINFSNKRKEIENEFDNKINNIKSDIRVIPAPRKPPVRYNPNKTTFDLDIPISAGNRIVNKQYRWQAISEADEKMLEKISAISWAPEDIKIVERTYNAYTFDFGKGDKKLRLNAVRILKKDEYELTLKSYEEQLTKHKVLTVAFEAQIAEKKSILEQEKADALARLDEQEKNANIKNNSSALVKKTVRHIFKLKELGVYNLGNLVEYENTTQKIILEDEEGDAYAPTLVYLANLDNNILMEFYSGKWAEIQFNPNSNNQLWIVRPDGKLAVLFPERFRKEIIENKKENIRLETIDRIISTEEDITEALRLGKSF